MAIARQHGLLIIEDAAYAYLAEQPPPPAGGARAGVDDLRLWPVQERCDWSALRIRALPTQFIEAFERAIHATTRNTPALMTAIATGWLNDGTVAGLETEKRVDARRRQTLARNVLDGFDAIGHLASYFL